MKREPLSAILGDKIGRVTAPVLTPVLIFVVEAFAWCMSVLPFVALCLIVLAGLRFLGLF